MRLFLKKQQSFNSFSPIINAYYAHFSYLENVKEYMKLLDRVMIKDIEKAAPFQFVVFDPLSYCFKETICFDKQASFSRPPVLRLIKAGDITKELQ